MPTTNNTEKYPVDVCYMVADLKYNKKQGVRICEVQQASLSQFNGDAFRNVEDEQSIHQELRRVLETYNKNGWVVNEGMADKKLVSVLASSPSWQNPKNLITLVSNPNFKIHAVQHPADEYDIAAYNGFLYINWSQLSSIYDFEERYPGLVIIDKSSFPLWIDKYRMTRIFNQDPVLAQLKPRWGNYKKKYTKQLADQIMRDLQCETVVIKPRGSFLGNGVIIVSQQELDEVLRYIITKKGKLSHSTDPAYAAWKKDSFDSFIVEEFVTSDPIKIPHLGNKTYQPTMRVAFLLTYTKHRHRVHFLGGYWKTPALSLEEDGDFMQKNKDVCKAPYYYRVDQSTMRAVEKQLRMALPRLHRHMLRFQPESQEELYASDKKQPRITLQEQIH